MPQRYVKINHELIPVTEDVYLAYNRPKEKERFMARRDGKCRQEDYRICSGDCATCPWQQEGHRMMSLHKVLGSECEKETPAMDSNTPNFDDLVADRMILEHLYQRLDTVVPDGARLFKLRAENYTEREICRELGVSTQSMAICRSSPVPSRRASRRTTLIRTCSITTTSRATCSIPIRSCRSRPRWPTFP